MLFQNDEISGSTSISNDNVGAINNWKKLNVQAQNSGPMPEFYVLGRINQVQCLGSMFRLNTQAQYLSFLC